MGNDTHHDKLPAGWHGITTIFRDAKGLLVLVALSSLVWNAAQCYQNQQGLPGEIGRIKRDLYGDAAEQTKPGSWPGLVREVQELRVIIEYLACSDASTSTSRATLSTIGVQCVSTRGLPAVPAPQPPMEMP